MLYCAMIVCLLMVAASVRCILKSDDDPAERGIALAVGTLGAFGAYGCAQALGWVP